MDPLELEAEYRFVDRQIKGDACGALAAGLAYAWPTARTHIQFILFFSGHVNIFLYEKFLRGKVVMLNMASPPN
jgi:hypothetical protein